MKKLVMVMAICALAVGTMAPAFAADLEYGGYWRTRAFTTTNFTGDDEDDSRDYSAVDARGRLWTRFLINDEMSWYNRVEFNVTWGDEDNGGGIGTDGTDYLRWKNSYVDLEQEIGGADIQFRIGLQDYGIAQGFLFDDDFAGLKVAYAGDNITVPFIWMKAFEGGTVAGDDDNEREDYDVDFVGLAPVLAVDDAHIRPFVFYLTSDNASEWDAATGNKAVDVFYAGLDIWYTPDWGSLWAVGIFESGTAESILDDDTEYDVSGFLVAAGGEFVADMGLGVHAEAFYASGDDDLSDDDVPAFFVPQGQSHIWSEIMGNGVFDANGHSNGSPGDVITNIWAVNGGLSYQFTDDLKVTGDVWYAQLAETNEVREDDDLGTEVDLRIDYMLNEDLQLTLIGAYLFAGDATTMGAEEEADPWELGMQLSFRFSED